MTTDEVRKRAIDLILETSPWELSNEGKDALRYAHYVEGIVTMCNAICEELEEGED